ncbi:MAG: hypothetical protein M3N13_02885 [Candidatus Eremiobacteraeota bacterium]|nr:hypothetical protein [Candidatus Eremiobacteraeota bacterium]
MTRPRPGLQAMHNGAAFEFLHLIEPNREGQIWRVLPLFVDEPACDRLIRTHDRLTPIHTQKPVKRAA